VAAPTVITPAATARVAQAAQAAPDTAGITSAYAAAAPAPAAAQARQIFHGLFQDTDRAAPVAAVVSQLWTAPLAEPDTDSASGTQPALGDMRNLFRDREQGT
jgi:hypothetical protein